METLDHEKFEALKELADIGAQIAEGRDFLATLQKNKEAFLDERSKELSTRIQATLAESKDSILEINKFQDELVKYRKDTGTYLDSLRYFNERVLETSKAINSEVDSVIQYLEEQSEKNEETKKELSRAKDELNSERAELTMYKNRLREEEIKLKDGQGTLKRAFERLKVTNK